jgi:hypothetical protein
VAWLRQAGHDVHVVDLAVDDKLPEHVIRGAALVVAMCRCTPRPGWPLLWPGVSVNSIPRRTWSVMDRMRR